MKTRIQEFRKAAGETMASIARSLNDRGFSIAA